MRLQSIIKGNAINRAFCYTLIVRGKLVQVDWFPSDDEASLKRAYQQEQNALVKPRLHGLWLVHQGKQVQEAAEFVGVHRRTAGEWLVWYRQGGLAAVRSHRRGGYGREAESLA